MITKNSISTILCAIALGVSSLSQAATPGNRPGNTNNFGNWTWSGHIEHVNIDKDAAWLEGIDDSATAIGFAAERYTDSNDFTLSLGASFLIYNDNDEFAQYVEDYWGDTDYSESDADAFMLFAEYGPKYRFGANNMGFFTARAGISGILGSERSISSCSNCYSEDIDIKGGAYGLLGVGQTFGRVDIGLQFKQYFSGDLDNSLGFKISGAF
jgi:hypothetical protein